MSCNECRHKGTCVDANTPVAVHCLAYNQKRVYIAGPITGVKGYTRHFERASRLLASKGFEPVSPIKDGLVEGADYRFYINRGLRLLEECEFICMLPGSNKSKGAMMELHYATTVGLPIMQISEDYTRLLGADMGEPSEIPDEARTCGNCNHSTKDFGIWICSEEASRYYNREVDLDEESCELWESDSE